MKDTWERVRRLPARLWYLLGLSNCRSSHRILHSIPASSFSNFSFLKSATQWQKPSAFIVLTDDFIQTTHNWGSWKVTGLLPDPTMSLMELEVTTRGARFAVFPQNWATLGNIEFLFFFKGNNKYKVLLCVNEVMMDKHRDLQQAEDILTVHTRVHTELKNIWDKYQINTNQLGFCSRTSEGRSSESLGQEDRVLTDFHRFFFSTLSTLSGLASQLTAWLV